ncbi:MAG: hypothetical protein ACJ75J_03600 [Cytophagaceae bacterium]
MRSGTGELSERKKLFERLLMVSILVCFIITDFVFYSNQGKAGEQANPVLDILAGLGTTLLLGLIGFYMLNLNRSLYYAVFSGFFLVYLMNIYLVFIAPAFNSADRMAFQEIALALFRSIVWIGGGILLIAEGGRSLNKPEIYRLFSISLGAFICINMLDQYSYLVFDVDPYRYLRYMFYIFMPMVFLAVFVINKNLRKEYPEAAEKMIGFMFLLHTLAVITFLTQYLFYESE